MTSIVIVDDRATNRTILTKLSRAFDEGVEVHAFSDPDEALAYFRVARADLIITDFKMPGMNGAEFIRRLRMDLGHEEIPVIVVTAYEDREYRYEALEAGATDFLLSPIDNREFRTRVRNILSAHGRTHLARVEATALRTELDAEKIQHAEAVAISERRLRQVLDTIPSFVFTTQQDGKVTLANRPFAAACGVPIDVLVGRPLGDSTSDHAFVASSLELDERVRAGVVGASASEIAFRPANGADMWLQVSKTRILDRRGEPPQILTVATDISSRREAERALLDAIEAANRSSRAKTTFLANMSHELRTPMNAIIGFADMMARQVMGPLGNERYREYSEHIQSSASHLQGMISDVLDAAQLEAGEVHLHESEFDLAAVFEEARTVMWLQIEESKADLRMDVAQDLRIYADISKLRQVLINLLANALNAADSGTILLHGRVLSDRSIFISVEDQGIGMTPDEIEVALSRFGRIVRPERSSPGAGLGLPLSADLVRLHGGTIRLQSEPGRGTRVEISLPAARLRGRMKASA